MKSFRSIATTAGILLGLLALTAPSLVLADTENDAHEHTGMDIGGQAAWFNNDKAISNGWYGGADLRFHFAPAIALEGSVDYQQATSINYYPVQASLLVYLMPQYRLTPYILGGGTWYFESGSGTSGNQFGPHAGAGLEFFMSRDWSLDASWRYLWIENPNSGSSYFTRSYSTNNYMVTAGIHYHF